MPAKNTQRTKQTNRKANLFNFPNSFSKSKKRNASKSRLGFLRWRNTGKRARAIFAVMAVAVIGAAALFTTRADNNANAVLAQQMLRNPNIAYWTNNGVNTRDVVVALSQGRPAYTTCGNASNETANINTNILRFIVEAGSNTYVMVNALTDKCHSSGSAHYSGEAVDLDLNSEGHSYITSVASKYGGSRNSETSHMHFYFPCSSGDCSGGSYVPTAGANTSNTVNPTGTDCHNYTLQYDPTRYYPCVRHLQIDIGFSDSEADGYYGSTTRSAVSNFQWSKGLAQTGVVDAATWCKIHPDLAGCSSSTPPAGANSSGGTTNNSGLDCHNYTLRYDPSHFYPCVKHLQIDIGFSDSEANGYFDDTTKEAVVNFQRSKGLTPDGIVGPQTWRAIHPDPATPTPPPAPVTQAVQGRIWRDDNANGQQDGGEPLIGNAGNCGSYVNVDASVAAAGQLVNADRCMNGPFYFIPTSPGFQTVRANAPAGWQFTNGNSRNVHVNSGQNVDVPWFGMRPTPTTPAPAPVTNSPTSSSSGSGNKIVGEGSNRCIDVPGQNFSNGQYVQLYSCNGSAAQKWTFLGNGGIQTSNNKCLDIAGYNRDDGARVEIYNCHYDTNQQWTRNPDGTIRSNLNGKCLDAIGFGTSNGTRLQMYTCYGTSNQRWRW